MSVYYPVNFEDFSKWLENGNSNPNLYIIKYSTTWCGPCKKCRPAFESLSREYPQVFFASVDIDVWEEEGQIENSSQDIRSFPTFHFINKGKILKVIEGWNEQLIRQFILTGS